MCRWMAYSGEPILAEELLFRPSPLDHRPEPARQTPGVHHER